MKRALCLILALILCASAAACAPVSPLEAQKTEFEGELAAHFINVGQGDSILLESDGEFALIDAGEYEYGEEIEKYLSYRGVKSLKYVIATHPHSDHIGGLRTVLNAFPTENFITVETDCDTYAWTKLLKAVDSMDINYIDAKPGDVRSLGSSTLTVLAPLSDGYEGYNDYSVVIKARRGDISMLLTGDAEKLSEYEMLDSGEDVSADLLKCGHHGSSSSTSTRFLQAVNPAVSIISCAKDNEYGHPHREVTERLKLLGCPYYCTADSGTLTASTDGKTLTVSASGDGSVSFSYTAGSPKNEDSRLCFVGNKSNGYFHDCVCDGALTMNPENRIEFDTREQAASEGYKPCPNCRP